MFSDLEQHNDLINTSITIHTACVSFSLPKWANVISALDSPAYPSSFQVDNPESRLLRQSDSVESVFPVDSSLEYCMRTFCEAHQLSLVCDLSGQLPVFQLPVHAIYSLRPLLRLPSSELSNHFIGQRLHTHNATVQNPRDGMAAR